MKCSIQQISILILIVHTVHYVMMPKFTFNSCLIAIVQNFNISGSLLFIFTIKVPKHP